MLEDWERTTPSKVTTQVSPDIVQEAGPFLVIILPCPELPDGDGEGIGVTEGLGVGVGDGFGVGVGVGFGDGVGAGVVLLFESPLIVRTRALPSCEGERV